MCSTAAERLAQIGRAIDELAAETGDGHETAGPGAGTGSMEERLARLWQMVAELDPELKRRIGRYSGAGE
jgi:hypothetical protein